MVDGLPRAPSIRFFTCFAFGRVVRAFRASVGRFGFFGICVFREESIARGLHESSRAVTQVDGLPRAPSFWRPNAHSDKDFSESVSSFGLPVFSLERRR